MQNFNSKLIVLDFNLTVVTYAVHKKQAVVVGTCFTHRVVCVIEWMH